MISSKEIAIKMEIEPIFHEKRIIRRKNQFQPVRQNLRNNFINHIAKANRSEKVKKPEKALDDNSLKKYCLNLESFLKHDVY